MASRNLGTPMSNRMKRRLNVFVAFMLMVFMGYLLVNLFSLTVIRSEEYQARAAGQQVKSIQINANRGTIYDSNMEIMANSATVWTLVAAPNAVKVSSDGKITLEEYKRNIATDLASILEMDVEDLVKKLNKDNMYEYIKKKMEKPEADKIRELITNKNYTFLTLIEDTKRYYPLGTSAAQVLGYTSENGGQYGVEQYYNDALEGTPGKILTAVDGFQNPIPTSYEKVNNAVAGQSLVLTLDSSIQHYAEQALENLVNTHKPLGGASAIVMDVNTGGILAMASSPVADPNQPGILQSDILKEKLANPQKYVYNASTKSGQYVEDEEKTADLDKYESELVYEQWKNLNTTMQYQPGSVFKIVTGASALESGKISYDAFSSYCSGVMEVADAKYRCHKHGGHGTLNFKQSIVNSCNPAFIVMGQLMGVELFSEYLDGFGITEKTGVDVTGEVGSTVVPEERMTIVDLASESFGQTLAITPIQMITAAAAIANGGYLLQPYVVAEVLDTDGNVIQKNQTVVKRQVISEKVSNELMDAMEAMVAAGSSASVPGYRIAGKSGTSQIQNQNSGRYVGSFLGVAPADDPQIAVLVVVNEPTSGKYYGNEVAGPALGSILKDTLSYMNINPDTEGTTQASEPAISNVLKKTVKEAKEELRQQGFTAEVIGEADDEAVILNQMPKSGVTAAKGSRVLLYTDSITTPEKVEMPAVAGLSPGEAESLLIQAGLNFSATGSNKNADGVTVSTQSLEAGTLVEKGSVVTLTYARTIVDG